MNGNGNGYEESEGVQDRRPDPKPRKHAMLWQSYQWWDELKEMRKHHLLRASATERGKCNYDLAFEQGLIVRLAAMLKEAEKGLAAQGEAVGLIWDWTTDFHGIGPHTAAKLLALIDDIGKFDTVAKLWRFSGYAVIDGQIDKATKGEKLPFNQRLKSELHVMADNMIRAQTPEYVPFYYQAKEDERRKHPEPMCSKCGALAVQRGQSWRCPECKASGRQIKYTPAHLDNRAKRKMIKLFLSHLWDTWRKAEGLPVTRPYVEAILGHEHIIAPKELVAR